MPPQTYNHKIENLLLAIQWADDNNFKYTFKDFIFQDCDTRQRYDLGTVHFYGTSHILGNEKLFVSYDEFHKL